MQCVEMLYGKPDIPSPKGIAALPVARQRGGAITKEERTNAFWARKDSNFTWATAFARGCRAICVTMQQEQFKRFSSAFEHPSPLGHSHDHSHSRSSFGRALALISLPQL